MERTMPYRPCAETRLVGNPDGSGFGRRAPRRGDGLAITPPQPAPGYVHRSRHVPRDSGSDVMTMSKLARSLPALVLAGLLPLAVSAQGGSDAASKQAATAAAHAGMAFGAADLKMTHTHLHHVVNCLVGPSGQGFDASAENPCKGMGNGAIADAKGDAATEARLQSALQAAQQGLQANTVASAHADAKKAMSLLQAK
jgi:hypothetical protein